MTLQAIGTTFDASDIPNDRLLAMVDETDTKYADALWDRAYAFAVIYDRKDWTTGLNRITFDGFVKYVQRNYPKRLYTKHELYSMRMVYITYTALPNAREIVLKIKEMSSLTNAALALPHVKAHPDDALDILELCQNTKQRHILREELEHHYPQPNQGTKQRLAVDDEDTRTHKLVLAFLRKNKGGMIDGKMMCLRSAPYEMETEWAESWVLRTYLRRNPHESSDDVAHAQFARWTKSLPADILQEAKMKWEASIEEKNGNLKSWPF